MKTTIDIADDLLLRAKQRARDQKTTLRQLMEDALAAELMLETEVTNSPPGMIVVDGDGLTKEFRDAGWEKIRNASYGFEF